MRILVVNIVFRVLLVLFVFLIGGLALGSIAGLPSVGALGGFAISALLIPLVVAVSMGKNALLSLAVMGTAAFGCSLFALLLQLDRDLTQLTIFVSLSISPLVAFAVVPSTIRLARHSCKQCDYDLRHLGSGRCPECGAKNDPLDKSGIRIIERLPPSGLRLISIAVFAVGCALWFYWCLV